MAQTVNIDLRLTLAQRNALRSALNTLDLMVNSAKYKTLLGYWDQMDAETRARVLAKAPLFARLVDIAKQLPRD